MTRIVILGAIVAAWSIAWGADASSTAWQALFAQTQPARAGRHLQDVLDACGGKVEPLKAMIAADAAYAEFPPGLLKRKLDVDITAADRPALKPPQNAQQQLQVDLRVRLPRGYSPKQSWPMLLVAHGQGGSGLEAIMMMESLLGRDREQYVVVAPTMPGPAVFNGKPYQEQTYLGALEWARLNLNIDDDRVYVSGYSQGGHVSWHLATMYPWLFAAAAPMAGVPWFEGSPYVNDSYLENTMHLPLWAIWGEKDRADPTAITTVDFCRLAAKKMAALGKKDFTGTELPRMGHSDCFPKDGEFAPWLAKYTRRAMPEKFSHYFHLVHHARSYYLQAVRFTHAPVDFDKPATVSIQPTPGREPTSQEVLRDVQYRLEKVMFQLWGELNRQGNSLAIRGRGIAAVRVLVMEGMFDLARPVTIQFAGKTWQGSIPTSPRCMLTHYAATRDAAHLVCNELEIDDAGKVAVLHAEK